MADAFRGPLKVDASGRYLVDSAGTPFLWLGDTGWPMFAEYPADAAERYLENRAKKGFTVVQSVLAWGKGSGFEAGPPLANCRGEVPWLNGNPATPNPRYFDHAAHLLEAAARHGIVVAALPAWGYYVNEAKAVTAANAREYGRWLGNRFKAAPNLVWVNGGDRIPLGFEEVYRELGRGLRAGDGGAHPITCHVPGPLSSSMFWHREDWLDLNMIQTWGSWTQVHAMVTSDRGLAPPKPVIHGEGAYEDGPEYPDGPITPLVCRRQAWWAFLAGAAGHTYGQNQMWRMEPGWEKGLDTPGAAQVGLIRKLLGSRRWWELVPDQSVIASGVSSERTLNAAARGQDRSWAIIYLASQCDVRLDPGRILAKRVRTTWIDPRSGETKDAGTFETGNLTGAVFPELTARSFRVPGYWEDALLVLEAT